jgi:hypothetical protein
MPRPSSWNSPTTAIRVPAHAVDALLALARQLDQADNVQNLEDAPAPYLFACETYDQGTQRYLICPPADASEETWAEADRLVDELFKQFPDEDDRLLLLANFAKLWGKPLK